MVFAYSMEIDLNFDERERERGEWKKLFQKEIPFKKTFAASLPYRKKFYEMKTMYTNVVYVVHICLSKYIHLHD